MCLFRIIVLCFFLDHKSLNVISISKSLSLKEFS